MNRLFHCCFPSIVPSYVFLHYGRHRGDNLDLPCHPWELSFRPHSSTNMIHLSGLAYLKPTPVRQQRSDLQTVFAYIFTCVKCETFFYSSVTGCVVQCVDGSLFVVWLPYGKLQVTQYSIKIMRGCGSTNWDRLEWGLCCMMRIYCGGRILFWIWGSCSSVLLCVRFEDPHKFKNRK